ncbi:hypothetical protein THAOC_15620, partial [Thalassiosira oceanica]
MSTLRWRSGSRWAAAAAQNQRPEAVRLLAQHETDRLAPSRLGELGRGVVVLPLRGRRPGPPKSIQDEATPEKLLERMEEAKVDGCLIVQPINHKFDHSYVSDAMRRYPDKFKGMLLHDPSLSPDMAVTRLEELVLAGFCGVRFNPYLWPEGKTMSEDGGNGLAVYKRCGELKVPVGVMCFKGLGLHLDDIEALISKSPDTTLILDHIGFCKLGDDETFEKLISLARHPNVRKHDEDRFLQAGRRRNFREADLAGEASQRG